MNKGVASGVRKYNTTNNDPSTSIVIDKSIGGVLRFFASQVSPIAERAYNTSVTLNDTLSGDMSLVGRYI